MKIKFIIWSGVSAVLSALATSIVEGSPFTHHRDSVIVKKNEVILTNDSSMSQLANTSINGVIKNNGKYFSELHFVGHNTYEFDILSVPKLLLVDSLEEQRLRAHSLRDEVEQSQRFRESLDAFSVTDLPIGIVKSGGLIDYSVIVDRVSFSPKGSELTAFMSFTVPQTGDRIAFGGRIPLSKDGGIVGTARIYLLGDHFIKMNNTSLLTIKGNFNSNTFVEMDCNGFKGMSVEGEVEFSKDLLLPEDDKGQAITDKRLKLNFQTYVQDWNELLVKVSVPPFQLRGLEGVGFAVQDAYLDWSDLTNPTGLVFPPNYQSTYSSSGQSSLWRGFYLRKAEVRLPAEFLERQATARVKVGIENLIIDDTGFSGQAFAENLIKEGDMSGWSYSLDMVKLGFVFNQVQQFELKGKITVPVFEKDEKASRMGYRASKGIDGNYIFAVSIQDKVKLPLWAADVALYNGSGISVKEKNNKFYPTATLNGMLSINTLSQGPKAELGGVRFEQMVISTEAPYFKPGVFGFGSEESSSKASGFPLVIRNIGIKSNPSENKVGLSLDVSINIGGDPSNEGFSGTAALIVWGKMETPVATNAEKEINASTHSGWNFDKVELSAVAITIKKPKVYDLSGSVRFFDDDPTYGDGFKGEVKGKLQKIDVKATTLFGKTVSYRYWFADALVEINRGVQLAPGLAAYGFGGGFFSRMKQTSEKRPGIGQTLSGITYIPDENSLGLKAYLNFGGYPSRQAFNGDLTLDVAMSRTGGISSTSLVGNAYFLTPEVKAGEELIKEGASKVADKTKQLLDAISPRSQVYGTVNIALDNVNDVFHGNIEVYANVVGGIVKGIGPGNKAGWAVLHFASDEWYVLIGTPDQPIGLEVARLFKSKSYIMMGRNLPGSPPPPAKVADILGEVRLDGTRTSEVQSGLGFAFGMSFGVDTGDLRFLMFYGRFAAGTGFDIMLTNNGNSLHCEESDEQMGVNGWYAMGQAYAYVEGKIGIKVNLKFYKGDYDIINIGAAAILQTKGPNPFWMKGIVGGQYRILGGLVKGQCRFEVTIGKDCKPVGESNPLQDVNIIAEVSPAKGADDVDVFNAPQAAFNIPIGEVFDITDRENKTQVFRARLAEFSVKEGSTTIDGTLKWNATNDVVVMDALEVLPSKKEIKVLVKVVFEERVGADWQSVLSDGKPVEETVETNFTTGVAPDFIPASNVEISYPIAGQYNFYPKEFNLGFIKLKKGQSYLFEQNLDWIQKARMTEVQSRQQYKEFNFTYDTGNKTISYSLPEGLSLATTYSFELLNMPKENKIIDANVTKVSTELIKGEQGAAELTTNEIEGQLNLREVKSLYGLLLRTSSYHSFIDKVKAISLSQTLRATIDENIFQLYAYMKGIELFDNLEVNGSPSFNPLVQAEAILEKNNWYQNFVFPMVYDGYPLLNTATVRNRNINILGLPPVKSILINELGYNPTVSDQNTSVYDVPSPYSNIRYDLMAPMFSDYKDIQLWMANYVVDKPDLITERFGKLLLNRFPIYRYGSYKVKLKYVIPGIVGNMNSYELELFNATPD